MQAAAHGNLAGTGPSPEVAREFIHANPKKQRMSFSKKGRKGKR